MTEIIETRNQFRRDFTADYKCEGCGHIAKKVSGYDDHYFHNQVVPTMICSNCGETSESLKADIIDNTIVPANLIC